MKVLCPLSAYDPFQVGQGRDFHLLQGAKGIQKFLGELFSNARDRQEGGAKRRRIPPLPVEAYGCGMRLIAYVLEQPQYRAATIYVNRTGSSRGVQLLLLFRQRIYRYLQPDSLHGFYRCRELSLSSIYQEKVRKRHALSQTLFIPTANHRTHRRKVISNGNILMYIAAIFTAAGLSLHKYNNP